MTKSQKFVKVIALVLGIALIAVGIYLLCMSDSHTGYAGGVSRASTSIEFGGDFYTTSAQYTGLAANAVVDLFDLVKYAFGSLLIFIGGIDWCVVLFYWNKKHCERLYSEIEACKELIASNTTTSNESYSQETI